jgi:DNA-binding NarL/FixJ family response regulator
MRYLLKEAGVADIITAIRGVANGESMYPPQLQMMQYSKSFNNRSFRSLKFDSPVLEQLFDQRLIECREECLELIYRLRQAFTHPAP